MVESPRENEGIAAVAGSSRELGGEGGSSEVARSLRLCIPLAHWLLREVLRGQGPMAPTERPTEPGLPGGPWSHPGQASPWCLLDLPSGLWVGHRPVLCLQTAGSAPRERCGPCRPLGLWTGFLASSPDAPRPLCLPPVWLWGLRCSPASSHMPCPLNPLSYSRNWVAVLSWDLSTEGLSCALGPGPDPPRKWAVDDTREHSGDVLCDKG